MYGMLFNIWVQRSKVWRWIIEGRFFFCTCHCRFTQKPGSPSAGHIRRREQCMCVVCVVFVFVFIFYFSCHLCF